MNFGPHRDKMLKTNWKFVYVIVVILDIAGYLFSPTIIINRIIAFLMTLCGSFYFAVTGAKGWWRTLIGGSAEFIPVIGDFLPFWIFTAWRIHKKNAAVGVTDIAGKIASKVGGDKAEALLSNTLGEIPDFARGKQNKQAIIERQKREDQLELA